MLESVEITNYQSIEEAHLAFGRLTVIVGPSGRGKSALRRALAAALFGQVGEDFIRFGKQKAIVTLSFDGGRELVWEKHRDKGATYTLDGKLFTRTGRAVPDEVAEALAVRRIDIDKDLTLRPQFQDQHDLPLLLMESQTMVARALGRLTKLQLIVEAQVECRRDRTRAERRAQADQEEGDRLKEQLETFPDPDELADAMAGVAPAMTTVNALIDRVQTIDALTDRLTVAKRLAELEVPSEKALNAAAAAVERAEAVTAKIRNYRRSSALLDVAQAESEAAREAVSAATNAYDTFVESIGACPMCGGSGKLERA